MYSEIYKAHIIVLYNRGFLMQKNDLFFLSCGLKVIRRGGKVVKLIEKKPPTGERLPSAAK